MSETYCELVIEGQPLLARGFLVGVVCSAGGKTSDILFSSEHDVETEGFIARLAEWAHLAATETFALIPGAKADLVERLLGETSASLGLKQNRRREIHSAHCDFQFTVYNRRQKIELEGVLRSDPQVRLPEDFTIAEQIDESAKGVEVYSAAHEYEASGHGTLSGPLLAVLALRGRLKANAFVKLSKVHLEC